MNPLCPLPWTLLPPRLRVKMSSLRKPVRSAPKATILRCLRARPLFDCAASPRLSPRLRASASKSHSRVAQPVPPRPRPWHGTLRFPSGNPSAPHRRPPSSAVSALVLSLTSPLLCAYLRVSASPRQNHSLRFPIPFHHGLIRGIELCVLYISAVNPLSPTPELPHPDSP